MARVARVARVRIRRGGARRGGGEMGCMVVVVVMMMMMMMMMMRGLDRVRGLREGIENGKCVDDGEC